MIIQNGNHQPVSHKEFNHILENKMMIWLNLGYFMKEIEYIIFIPY